MRKPIFLLLPPILLILLLPSGLRAQTAALPQISVAGKPAYQLDRPVVTPKVVAPTDVFPHPPINIAALGAKCDGVTDDTKALQDAINTSCSQAVPPPIYIPSSAKGCVVTKSINITSGNRCHGLHLVGDFGGRGSSRLVANFPSSQPYPVLDYLGCKGCGLWNLNIAIPERSYATAGILVAPDGPVGVGNFNFICRRSGVNVAYPGPSSVVGIVVAWADENKFTDCEFAGGGVGAIIGNGLGRAKSIRSEYGNIGTTTASMTQFSCVDCMFGGQQGSPALQLTGSDAYNFEGKTYLALINASTNSGGIVEFTDDQGRSNSFIATDFRTENQSHARGVCALNFDGTHPSSDIGFVAGYLWSGGDADDYAICGTGNATQGLRQWTIKASGGGAGGFFNFPERILQSDIEIGQGSRGVGKVNTFKTSRLLFSGSTDLHTLVSGLGQIGGDTICNYFDCEFSNSANGEVALAGGTATVPTTDACNVSSNCLYYLTNCGTRGTAGTLSVGTITPGARFVINSTSRTDTSKVCWAIKGN